MKLLTGLIVCFVLNFIGVKLLVHYRKMIPKSILAYCLLPLFYLIFAMFLTTWGFVAIFGIAVLCIVIFLFKQSIPYFKPKRYEEPYQNYEVVEAEVIEDEKPASKKPTPKIIKPKKTVSIPKPIKVTNPTPVISDDDRSKDDGQEAIQRKQERLQLLLHRISFYAVTYTLIICVFLFLQQLLTPKGFDYEDIGPNKHFGIVTMIGTLQLNTVICLAIIAFICRLFDLLDRAIPALSIKRTWHKIGLFIVLSTFCILYYKTQIGRLEREVCYMIIDYGIWFCLGILVFFLVQLVYMVVDFTSFMQFQFARRVGLFRIVFLNVILLAVLGLVFEATLSKQEHNVDFIDLLSIGLCLIIFLLERKSYIQAKSYVNRLS